MTRPVYILSYRHRDELSRLAMEAGWQVVAARQPGDAGSMLAESAAAVAVLDARDAADEAERAAVELGKVAAGRGAALLVLVSRDQLNRLDALRVAGATHFLTSPFTDDEFSHALRFAAASAERREGERRGEVPTGDALSGFLARDLKRALAANEIEILFQPQVAIASGTIAGVEALMRWQHADYGAFGAEQLLDAADRAGLIRELSAHVHARALTLAAAWPARLAGLRLSLNVTAEDVATPGFAADFGAVVRASGFAPDRLTLELTERGLIVDTARTSAVLAELRVAGMQVAIDDFGAGYSSLAYLSRLPLDYLKLDRLLVHDVAGTERDRVVLRGILQLAESLGLAVIAEGVETEEQRDLLKREGCAFYQGYLCAPPLGVKALAELVV